MTGNLIRFNRFLYHLQSK